MSKFASLATVYGAGADLHRVLVSGKFVDRAGTACMTEHQMEARDQQLEHQKAAIMQGCQTGHVSLEAALKKFRAAAAEVRPMCHSISHAMCCLHVSVDYMS